MNPWGRMMGQLLVQGTECSEPQPRSHTAPGMAGGQIRSDLGGVRAVFGWTLWAGRKSLF